MNIDNVKYPKTLHLPWSKTVSKDDKVLLDTSCFDGKEIIITEKMDGECSGATKDIIHARSLELKGLTEKQEWSRTWLKGLWASIRHDIPPNIKIFGENLFAKHSIYYEDLPTYFMVFNIIEKDTFLGWDEIEDICFILGLSLVPIIYRGVWDEEMVRELWDRIEDVNVEGYVVRNSDSFKYDDFNSNVAKFVRENHVQTDKHWTQGEKDKNQIKETL